MTPSEVAAILRQFNDWRRGHHDDTAQPDPREIGEAIDAAVEMIDRLEAAERERDAAELMSLALRAKIEQMERQKPVATIHINSITGNPGVDFIPGHRYLHHNSSLYALPGAKGE